MKTLEYIGAALGMAGTLALALKAGLLGFILYIVSDLLLLVWCYKLAYRGLLIMYAVFTILSTIGAVNYL